MQGKTFPVHQPEYRRDKQEGYNHRENGKKPHLFLMRGRNWFVPMRVMVGHDFTYTSDTNGVAIRCSPHKGFNPSASQSYTAAGNRGPRWLTRTSPGAGITALSRGKSQPCL